MPKSIITKEMLETIKALYAGGSRYSEISRLLGIKYATVRWSIVNDRKTPPSANPEAARAILTSALSRI